MHYATQHIGKTSNDLIMFPRIHQINAFFTVSIMRQTQHETAELSAFIPKIFKAKNWKV